MKALALVPCVLTLAIEPAFGGAIDFNRDIRPMLSNACYQCHGPDEHDRAGGLRLDDRASAVGETSSGLRAIVPGKPDHSELVRRIDSTDDDERMPPPSVDKRLTETQKQLLREWIAEGAEYKPHWAFVKPVRPAVPDGAPPGPRSGNSIDAFVTASLAKEGLALSPTADRFTLVRRVYLDLIGLPPTPDEADTFVNDPRDDAYERLVDRLLASPHYGERWARRWLDLARYADTNGYEKDRPRSMWPYRDWVIQALNDDMPFDQFTIRQLAGDMLPDATIADIVATGFHRNTMINEEGGIDPQEFRFYANVDRVGVTSVTWLGLTIACAQCHTHKYDPITHQDYYRLMAYFDQADERQIDVPRPELTARRAELERRIAAAEADLPNQLVPRGESDLTPRQPLEAVADGGAIAQGIGDAAVPEAAAQHFESWVRGEAAQAVRWSILTPRAMTSNLATLDLLEDGSILASGDQTKLDVYELSFTNTVSTIAAIRLEALPDESLPAGGPGRTFYEGPVGDFSLSNLKATVHGTPVKFSGVLQTVGEAQQAIDDKSDTAWSIHGGQGKRQAAIFILASPLVGVTQIDLELTFEKYYAAALGRFRVSVADDARPVKTAALPADVEALLVDYPGSRQDPAFQRVYQYWCSVAPELAPARQKLDELRRQVPAYPTTLVMQQRREDRYRQTHRHHRGEYLQAEEVVTAGVPGALTEPGAMVPPDRLAFARWLVDVDNPLTARVTMNRQWAAFFGHGLVRTQDDFGMQGDVPTHPELLDWLAVEFMETGWSLKRMHRLIVTSATYCQTSRSTPALQERDPLNILLTRGPRVRLEAEIVRDAMLRASGLMSEDVGGPSVFPPQPLSITTEGTHGALQWKVSQGKDRYRRSLYTFAKRTAPFAMLATFDAPSGESCLPRRDVTNTPLQALTLLNDAMFVEIFQAFGRTYAAQESSVEERVRAMFRRCLTRPPLPDEQTALVQYWHAQRARFADGQRDAQALAGDGTGSPADRAAWTALARVLLNTHEAITKH